MGLYLSIFDDDEDIDGVEVGPYADFNKLREFVVDQLEGGEAGSRFPTFILHSDSDGEWPTSDCLKLREELAQIAADLKKLPAIGSMSDWQKDIAKSISLVPRNAFESFIDVDGEFLIERLQGLVDTALRRGLPILFQ